MTGIKVGQALQVVVMRMQLQSEVFTSKMSNMALILIIGKRCVIQQRYYDGICTMLRLI